MDWDSVIGKNGLDNPQPPQQVFEILENTKPDGDFVNPPPTVDKNGKPKPVFNTKVERLSDIYQAEPVPIKFFVEDMLTAGFMIFGGRPKTGKSFLMQQLAVSIASGKPFFGHNTRKSSVLYLDLEGAISRTQARLNKQRLDIPDNIYIQYRCRTMDGEPVTLKDNQLILYLEQILTEIKPSPELIIIDTLAKIKGGENGRLNAYENDSRIFGKLQDFAIERGICIIGVTHLTKAKDSDFLEDDWIERFTGSMGLVGVGDNLWGLFKKSRGENEREAMFRIASRDFQEHDYMVRHDIDTCRWDMISDNAKKYAAETHPFMKFLFANGNVSGPAWEISKKYLDYCEEHKLFPRIDTTERDGQKSDKVVISKRFSHMIRKLQKEILPFNEYTLHCKVTNKGRFYSFEKYDSSDDSSDDSIEELSF